MHNKIPPASNGPIVEGGMEKSEHIFNQIVHHHPEAFYTCDATGRITCFNQTAVGLWGGEPEMGKEKWYGQWKLYHPDGKPLPFESSPMALALKESRAVKGQEIIIERSDGIRRNILPHSQPLFDEEGKIKGSFNILTDITEQKIVENELREKNKIGETLDQIGKTISTELELNKVVQAITDAATGVSGAQFGAFFYNSLNDQGGYYTLYTISGVPKEKFSQFPMPRKTEIFAPTFQGSAILRSDDITKDPRYGKYPPHYGMPKGHLPVKSYLSVPVISRTGEVFGGLVFGHSSPGIFTQKSEDLVTSIAAQAAIAMDNSMLYEASKKDKEKLAVINSELNEKNEELQKINVDLDNFIYIASHDLKSPVANIEGLLYTLFDMLNVENSSKEELNSVLKMMKLSVNRFLHTISDLTIITKIQKDTEEQVVEKIDLLELIEDIKLLNGDLIANSGARIIIEKDDNMEISFSRKNLKSILYNMITNAIKYQFPERVPVINISTEKKEKFTILKIKDNGLGLDENKQKKLFSMFKRFHDHVEGTGIGLYLVKRIITNAGGRIEVESQPDEGSTFKIYFPEYQ